MTENQDAAITEVSCSECAAEVLDFVINGHAPGDDDAEPPLSCPHRGSPGPADRDDPAHTPAREGS